jgi:Uma2 family endonuclease
MNVAALAPVRKLTRREYDRLVEMGWFVDERIELIDGILLEVSPRGTRHAEAVSRLTDLLAPSLAGRARVRVQLPLGVGDDSEPEPDVAVVPLADYSRGHPETAHLVVEVAESSLVTDRLIKAQLYARGAIPEYWLIDLAARVVEVYRDPQEAAYRTVVKIADDGALTPLRFPDITLSVADLLPTV